MFSEILSENTILNNKYRIVKNLYKDEDTSIYLALDLSSEKKFAIKQMDNDKEKTVYETSTFELKEAAQKRVRLDKKANSPEIVDFFTDEKSKYIIIDYTDDSILEKLQLYPSIGKTLKERYIVVRGVSRGGFGSVYLIRDASLPGKYWALKEMHDESNGLEIIEKSFKIEAEMLAKLEHNSIPRITDFFVDGKRLFLVMDYIKGETLKKRLKTLKDEDYFSEEEIIEWALQICDVLAYLHNREKPIIFRDLKPDNIMITEENRIKLIDFGIARVFEGSKKRCNKICPCNRRFCTSGTMGRKSRSEIRHICLRCNSI